MSIRTPSSFGVGELLFSSAFRITPQEVAGWERARVLGGRDDRPGFRVRLEQPPVAGSPVPEGLVLARALSAIERSSGLGGCRLEQTSAGKLRVLGRVSVGEPLSSIATVRYRSVAGEQCFLTLAIEIRGDGRKLAEVEVGVEVVGPVWDQPLQRRWGQAA
ncbi:hypothetical protein ENSA5_67760 [Enhygromyxa salina]|uniref:Uncharacterized protein n=1 Tax=Enhygromyxa salina TaxID=215803 RepID=A0A2S9XB75_9BACT|nr:hypothetical protein [Enhygromyxa salina]PRP90103.1 hypothetical protein ENSA5_67760 [Enhygromyxa salina]